MQAALSAAISSISASVGLARVAIDARDDSKARSAIADIQGQLLDVMSKALSLQERIAVLQNERDKLKADLGELQRSREAESLYVLEEINPGSLVLAYRPSHEGDKTPVHYRCKYCHDSGSISTLKPRSDGIGYACHINTKHNIYLGGPVARFSQQIAGGGWLGR